MSDRETVSTFGSASAAAVLRSACTMIGESASGAELLRLGENAIFRLAAAPIVVRIARGMDRWEDATKEVAVSVWLADKGISAARAANIPQPVAVDGHPVTFWHFIDGRSGNNGDVRELGAVLRRLHGLEAPPDLFGQSESPLLRVGQRIAGAPVSPDDKTYLSALADRLSDDLERTPFVMPPCVTHGDAHVQNLMFADGRSILIDFERVGFGQPEWDLSVTATEFVTAKFWTRSDYQDFVESYGFDVTAWPGFDVLRRVQELKMTTWLMQNVRESPEIQSEFERRMAVIRAGRPDGAWRAF
ncbi:aminoglycoside phosphotransferase family protein [Pseudonocardia xishanensis]|uniref:Aminoglycoside phosphotransferase family protein n=1 Tax=Pseudonocardia xishanensis TaxID=630995 RepID=A0ABP8RE59_9PSEU